MRTAGEVRISANILLPGDVCRRAQGEAERGHGGVLHQVGLLEAWSLVTHPPREAMEAAIDKLDDTELNGRRIRLVKERERWEELNRTPGCSPVSWISCSSNQFSWNSCFLSPDWSETRNSQQGTGKMGNRIGSVSPVRFAHYLKTFSHYH